MSATHLEDQIRIRARRMRQGTELALTVSARASGKVPTAEGLIARARASSAQSPTNCGVEIGILMNMRYRHLMAIPEEPGA